jgi:hypothetical protein
MSENDENTVDIRVTKATPLEAGAPVPNPLGDQILGGTFAERAAAAKKASSKQVDPDDDDSDAENKAVAKKRTTRKS